MASNSRGFDRDQETDFAISDRGEAPATVLKRLKRQEMVVEGVHKDEIEEMIKQ